VKFSKIRKFANPPRKPLGTCDQKAHENQTRISYLVRSYPIGF
jgi:hypothetical protein